MNVFGLWDLNEKKVEELLYLLIFGVLEVKYDLDKTGMKNRQKRQNFMHWNEARDALSGSTTNGPLA